MFNGMTFSKGQNSAAIYRQPITIDFTKDLQLVLIRRNFSGTPCIMMVPILPGMTNSHIYIKSPASSVLSIGRHLTYAFKRGLLFWRQTPCQVVCKKRKLRKINTAFVSYLTKFIQKRSRETSFQSNIFPLEKMHLSTQRFERGVGVYWGLY